MYDMALLKSHNLFNKKQDTKGWMKKSSVWLLFLGAKKKQWSKFSVKAIGLFYVCNSNLKCDLIDLFNNCFHKGKNNKNELMTSKK